MEPISIKNLEEYADKQHMSPPDKTYHILSQLLASRNFSRIKLSEIEACLQILQRKKDKSKISSIFSKKAKVKFSFKEYLELFWKILKNSSCDVVCSMLDRNSEEVGALLATMCDPTGKNFYLKHMGYKIGVLVYYHISFWLEEDA